MAKNRSINSERTKEVVKYLYTLAKRKGYLQDIMNAAGVTNIKSLQWSYTQGKISEEQISGYVAVLGVDRDFITGFKQMTTDDQQALEVKISNKSEDSKSSEIDYVSIGNPNEHDGYMEIFNRVYAVVELERGITLYRVAKEKDNQIIVKTPLGNVVYEREQIYEIFQSNCNEFFNRLSNFIENLKLKVGKRVHNIEKRKQMYNYINALFTREGEVIGFINDYISYMEQMLLEILIEEPFIDDVTAQIYFMIKFIDFIEEGEVFSFQNVGA
jgi:hypothetical protein